MLRIHPQGPAAAHARPRVDNPRLPEGPEEAADHHRLGVHALREELRGERLVRLQGEDRQDVDADAHLRTGQGLTSILSTALSPFMSLAPISLSRPCLPFKSARIRRDQFKATGTCS